jgi:RNA polymerase sigma-70 factor, ECF subfamily
MPPGPGPARSWGRSEATGEGPSLIGPRARASGTSAVSTDEVTELALAARAGDRAAATAFVRATQVEVWRFVASLNGPGQADDLTQDTYLRAFRALRGYAARASARTWLLAIARRVCADHVRTAVRQRRVFERLLRTGTDTTVSDRAGLSATAELLHRLPVERKVAFVLTQVIGLSYEEAAQVEGVPIGTIRSRVARARTDLAHAVRAAQAG